MVCNGSFDQYTSIATGLHSPGSSLVTCGWDNASMASPDDYNSAFPSPVNIPNTFFGTHTSHSGSGMLGFVADERGSDWHEYVYQELNNPLVAGVTYELSFWVKTPSTFAVNGIGGWLTDLSGLFSINGTNSQLIGATPQVNSGVFITSSMGWTEVKQQFVAAGGEDHLVIGNFGNAVSPTTSGYYMPYYFLDDVSLKPVLDLTVTATPTAICQGYTSTLTIEPGVPTTILNWTPNGSLSCSNCSTVYASPAATTIYTATINYFPGCTIAPTVTVTVNMPPPAPVMTSTDLTTCGPGPVTFSITNFNPLYTYSTPTIFPLTAGFAGPVSSTGTFAVNWGSSSSGATIVVLVTDENGCITKGIVNVNSCCVPPSPSIVNFVNSNASAMISTYMTGSTISNKTFYINGTFTVDQSIIWAKCDVFLGQNAKIVLANSSTLTIAQLSHLQAGCDEMWDGIYIPDVKHTLEVISFSKVEDAKNAVVSDLGGIYYIENSFLNKNYKGIVVNAYAFPHTGKISGSTISCLPLGTLLLSPYSTERSMTGIELNNVTNSSSPIVIGNTASPTAVNTFNNLDIGVQSNRSHSKIVNNSFKNIATSGSDIAIAAINAIGKPFFPIVIYKVTVGGYGTNEANTFSNCQNGVHTAVNMNADVYNNSFNFIREYGVNCEFSNLGCVINIKDNELKNALIAAIRAYSNANCVTSIFQNDISVPAYSIFGSAKGIWLQELSHLATGSAYKVFNNKIANTRYGIIAEELYRAILDNNKIQVKPGAGPIIGIQVINNYGTQVSSNLIDNLIPTTNISVGGIYESQSQFTFIKCNNIKELGYDIKCAGPLSNPSTLSSNYMTMSRYGIVLSNNGIVGPQGTSSFPGCNQWTGGWGPGTYKLYSQVGTNGSLSPFYTNTSGSGYVAPVYIGNDGSSTNISTSPASGPCSICSYVVFPPGIGMRESSEVNTTPVMPEQTTPGTKENGVKENCLFDKSMEKSVNVSSISKIVSVYSDPKSTEDELSEVQAINNTISPSNIEESNFKVLNTAYLNSVIANRKFNNEELGLLRELAKQCPFTHGNAVYMARVLMQPYDEAGTEYHNSCEESENERSIEGSIVNTESDLKIYPNPNNGIFSLLSPDGNQKSVIIYDMMGKVVYTSETSSEEITIDISDEPKGVYLIKIKMNNTTEVRKLVNQ
jgi:hypothetical protein